MSCKPRFRDLWYRKNVIVNIEMNAKKRFDDCHVLWEPQSLFAPLDGADAQR